MTCKTKNLKEMNLEIPDQGNSNLKMNKKIIGIYPVNHRLPICTGSGFQIFELKHLADMEADYKRKCRFAIKAYKSWCKGRQAQKDVIELLYGNLEGVMLRRQAENSIEMYWTLRRDFRREFKSYLEKSCRTPFSYLPSNIA